MKDKIIEFLEDQIEGTEILKMSASGSQLNMVYGAAEAFQEVKDFIHSLEDNK